MTCEQITKTPPKEWYGAIAFPGEGIRMVMSGSEVFHALHPDIEQQMLDWMHCEPQLRSGDQSALSYVREAEELIQNVTGFHPKDIISYAQKLTEEYKGQSMGPFPFYIDWIIR